MDGPVARQSSEWATLSCPLSALPLHILPVDEPLELVGTFCSYSFFCDLGRLVVQGYLGGYSEWADMWVDWLMPTGNDKRTIILFIVVAIAG